MERNESQAERKPIIALGELLVDFIPENPEEGIADTGCIFQRDKDQVDSGERRWRGGKGGPGRP